MKDLIIGVVPARSGSKGFPNKNIAMIEGKTLIEHAVNCGLKSDLLSEVLISTDSEAYESIAVNSGAKSLGLRPVNLSTDTSKSIDVIIDLLDNPELAGVTHVVLLQPTSPLRSVEQLEECIRLAVSSGESSVTVAKVEDPHPSKLKKIDKGVLMPFLDGGNSEVARQELPEVYELTGAIYVSSVENIRNNRSFFSSNTVPYISKDFVNIDSERDYRYLKYLISEKLVKLD